MVVPEVNYYHLEKFICPHWVSTGTILTGDYRHHLIALEGLRTKFAPTDFRLKRISEHTAEVFERRGMKIMEKIND